MNSSVRTSEAVVDPAQRTLIELLAAIAVENYLDEAKMLANDTDTALCEKDSDRRTQVKISR